jgi:hypothetical protein
MAHIPTISTPNLKDSGIYFRGDTRPYCIKSCMMRYFWQVREVYLIDFLDQSCPILGREEQYT